MQEVSYVKTLDCVPGGPSASTGIKIEDIQLPSEQSCTVVTFTTAQQEEKWEREDEIVQRTRTEPPVALLQ